MAQNKVRMLLSVLVVLTIVATACGHATPAPICEYDFDSGTMGWMIQTYTDSQAVTAVVQSSTQAKSGKYSLEMTTNLMGGDEHRSKGEAYVDIVNPSTGEKASINLNGKAISAWVYAPKGAAGDPSHPNGVQLFVKSVKYGVWASEYGSWVNITENAWFKVTVTPSRTTPPDGYMDSAFDPTEVVILGIKIGSGSGSTAIYDGPIFLDLCTCGP